jgi:hypothetical protein
LSEQIDILGIANPEEKQSLAPLVNMARLNKLSPVEQQEVMHKLAAAGLM